MLGGPKKRVNIFQILIVATGMRDMMVHYDGIGRRLQYISFATLLLIFSQLCIA